MSARSKSCCIQHSMYIIFIRIYLKTKDAMKKISIISLGWLGMPLALSLMKQGCEVVGSKTTLDGVKAMRASGIQCYRLIITPEMICKSNDLNSLLRCADALVITLPVRLKIAGNTHYCRAVRILVNKAEFWGIPRIIFTSSTSVYGNMVGILHESSPLQPNTLSGQILASIESWLHAQTKTSVDILRLAGLIGPGRHPGHFLAGKINVRGGLLRVNLVHRDDVIKAVRQLLKLPNGGHLYNICAPYHPVKKDFYQTMTQRMHLDPPQFSCETGQIMRIINGNRICEDTGFEYQYPNPMNIPVIY